MNVYHQCTGESGISLHMLVFIQTDGGAGDAMAFGVDCEIDNDMDGREGTHGRLHGSDWSGPGCHFFSAIGPGS